MERRYSIDRPFHFSLSCLAACRARIGVTESLFMSAAVALTANAHAPATRSRAIAVFDSAQLAGVVMGGWNGGSVAHEWHWRWAFCSPGLLKILYAVPYMSFLNGTSEEAEVETRKSDGGLAMAVLARVPTYRLLCVVFPAFTFVLGLLYTWPLNFFFEKFSLSLAEAGFTAAFYLQAATLAGLLPGGAIADWLCQKTKAARLWLAGAELLRAAPCVHRLGNSGSLFFAKLAAVGFGLGSGVVIANLMVSSFEVIPADTRASSVGCLNLIGAMVSGFAALLGGVWKETAGVDRLMSCAAIACLLASLLLVLGIRCCFPRDYDRVHYLALRQSICLQEW